MRQIIPDSKAIEDIGDQTTDVHIVFRPSEKEIFYLIGNCPNLRSIQMPKSHFKTVSSTTKNVLLMNGIELQEGSINKAERFVL